MPYLTAWIVIAVAALIGLGCLHRLTRAMGRSPWRTVLHCLVAAWFLLPAPVPGYDGHYAPAFVVLIFESFFQQAGSPATALAILCVGAVLIVALVVTTHIRQGRRQQEQPEQPEQPEQAEEA